MNENLDLCKILNDCPKGSHLYCPFLGYVEFLAIKGSTIQVKYKYDMRIHTFFSNGTYTIDGECMLFPSKDQRDWSKFKAPVKKFNPEEFKPFDCVLVRKNYSPAAWYPRFFNAIDITGGVNTTNKDELWACCVPYNDETKYLLGTTNDCPEFYKWWKK